MSIRIGVDARPLIKEHGGIPRYVYELVKELSAFPDLRLVLFSHKPLRVPPGLDAELVIDKNYAFLPGTLWYILRAGYLARKLRINLFWAPNHIVPWLLPDTLPVITTVHDLVYLLFPQTVEYKNLLIHKLLFARSLKRSQILVTCSRTVADEIVAAFPRQKFAITTISPGCLSITQASPFPLPDLPYLLFVGTIEPRKNLAALLRVFMELVSQGGVFNLLLAGMQGWDKQLSLPEKWKHRVIMTGKISDQELIFLMRNAHCLIMPSLYEGFGLPVLEAAGKCPVIAADIAVFRELQAYMPGLQLVDFHDSTAEVASRMRDLLHNHTAPIGFTDLKIEKKFTWANAALEFRQLFHHAVGRHKEGGLVD